MSQRLVVSYLDGAWIVAGDVGEAGLEIRVSDPWGNQQVVTSGSKPEWGPGGFEVVAPHAAEHYTIDVGGVVWHFEHRQGVTYLTWRVEEPEPPEPEPEPPEPEPEPEDRIEVLPGRIYSARLVGDLVYWSEGRDADAAWWHLGQYLPGVELWLPQSEPALPLLMTWATETRLQAERLERVVGRLVD